MPRVQRSVALLIASVTLLGASLSASAAPSDESKLDRPRIERWLGDGDRDLIVQSFRRHPAQVLSFFDHYLEGGLKIIEGGGSEEQGLASFRTGLKLAQVATDALHDPIFSEYAANFASWDGIERKHFREGQRAFHEGVKALEAGDAAKAAAAFERSIDLAEPLGDAWGLAMAWGGLAAVRAKQSDWQGSMDAAMVAAETDSRLGLRDDELEQLLIQADARRNLKLPDAGTGPLRLAFSKLRKDDDAEVRTKITSQLVEGLERLGRMEEASKIRAKAGMPASTAPPTTPPSAPPGPIPTGGPAKAPPQTPPTAPKR